MCIRDSSTTREMYIQTHVRMISTEHVTAWPVSYTHLDVYKRQTAYEMESRDWSSDVCSSDLLKVRAMKLLELENKKNN